MRRASFLVGSLAPLFAASCHLAPEEGLGALEQRAVVCAHGATVEGVDVSNWNGTIDWNQVKSPGGKVFAVAECGDGLWVNPTFQGHWSAIKSVGLIRGAYHFFRPNDDPVAQANLVIGQVGRLGSGDLPVMMDVESPAPNPSPAVYNQRLHQFADALEQGTGKRPILYTGKYYWAQYVGTPDFNGYPLWHAQYTTAGCPDIADAWGDWKLWQYRASPYPGIPGGTCPGISGWVDLDHFNGTLDDLKQFAGQATCTPHCEGAVIVGADCGHGDCAAFGSGCVDDALGVRCVFAFCPATGEKDVCLDSSQISHCSNGALAAPGDCGAFAGYCSNVDAPTGARCVSVFCVSGPDQAPAAHDGCWFQSPSRQAHCDGNGALSLTDCPANEQCSVVDGVHCGPKVCPDTGTTDLCVSDSVIGHCVEGSVVSAGNCGMFGAYCSTAGGGAPRCVSVFCVAKASDVPVDHDVCLPNDWKGHCTAEGALDTAAVCPAGETCAGGACGTPPDAGAPGLDAGQSAGEDASSEIVPGDGGGTNPGADGGQAVKGDGGAKAADSGAGFAPSGACGCGAGGSPSGMLALALVALAISRRRRHAG
jgi:uncharacterized protein (TIGR03382 family)